MGLGEALENQLYGTVLHYLEGDKMGSNPGSCIVDFFVSFHVLVLLVVSCRSGVLCVAAQSRHRQKTISFPPLLSPSSMAPCSLVPASSVLLRLGVAGSDSRCQFQAETPAWPPAHSVPPIGSGIRDVAIGGGGYRTFPPSHCPLHPHEQPARSVAS